MIMNYLKGEPQSWDHILKTKEENFLPLPELNPGSLEVKGMLS